MIHTWRQWGFCCGSTVNNWRRWSDNTINVAMENGKNVTDITRDVDYQTEIGGGIKNKTVAGITDN